MTLESTLFLMLQLVLEREQLPVLKSYVSVTVVDPTVVMVTGFTVKLAICGPGPTAMVRLELTATPAASLTLSVYVVDVNAELGVTTVVAGPVSEITDESRLLVMLQGFVTVQAAPENADVSET